MPKLENVDVNRLRCVQGGCTGFNCKQRAWRGVGLSVSSATRIRPGAASSVTAVRQPTPRGCPAAAAGGRGRRRSRRPRPGQQARQQRQLSRSSVLRRQRGATQMMQWQPLVRGTWHARQRQAAKANEAGDGRADLLTARVTAGTQVTGTQARISLSCSAFMDVCLWPSKHTPALTTPVIRHGWAAHDPAERDARLRWVCWAWGCCREAGSRADSSGRNATPGARSIF